MIVAGAEDLSGDFQLFGGISLHTAYCILVTRFFREWAFFPYVNTMGRRHSKVPERAP